jgi:hypothetical protein
MYVYTISGKLTYPARSKWEHFTVVIGAKEAKTRYQLARLMEDYVEEEFSSEAYFTTYSVKEEVDDRPFAVPEEEPEELATVTDLRSRKGA